MAQRTLSGGSNTVVYLHGDHLGSTLLLSRQDGTYAGQWYTPWGDRRTPPAISETTREYTGQKRDGTGLLFYNARYYDPALARFVSPDTIVPGTSAGSGGAAATVGSGATSSLTVDFHEGEFVSQLNAVNAQRMAQGFWFELSGQQRQQAEGPSGPANPQALNRYSYVLNNPLRYTDPTGHCDTRGPYVPQACSRPVPSSTGSEGAPSRPQTVAQATADAAAVTAAAAIVADDDEDEYANARGNRRNQDRLRGGSQRERDRDFGIDNPDFWDWWHRTGKHDAGGRDIQNAREARERYNDWLEQGGERAPKSDRSRGSNRRR